MIYRLLDATEAEITEAVQGISNINASLLREVVERAKLAAIRRSPTGVLRLTGSDISTAALQLREHADLLRGRPPEKTAGEKFASILGDSLGTHVGLALSATALAKAKSNGST